VQLVGDYAQELGDDLKPSQRARHRRAVVGDRGCPGSPRQSAGAVLLRPGDRRCVADVQAHGDRLDCGHDLTVERGSPPGRSGPSGLPCPRLATASHRGSPRRHATLLLAQGVHPKVAAERLGHSTI
jgi:hypothetical protein